MPIFIVHKSKKEIFRFSHQIFTTFVQLGVNFISKNGANLSFPLQNIFLLGAAGKELSADKNLGFKMLPCIFLLMLNESGLSR